MKVFQAIADAVVDEGCAVAFGLMGDANMPIYAGFAERPDLVIHSARHEGGAVGMADGYQRATKNVGVVTLTWGPGLMHAATQLTVAARSRTPMVVLTGVANPRSPNRFALIDNQRFADTCGVRYMTVASVDNLAQDIAEAFYAARRHRVPVILGVPIDMQTQDLEWEWDYVRSIEWLPEHRSIKPDTAALAAVFDALAAASRPVLLAGRGALGAGAGPAIARIGDQIGALLATSLFGKGMFSGNAWDVGVAGAFASGPTEALLAEADFVLAFGAELGYFTTEGGLLFPAAKVGRIDIRDAPDEIGMLPGLYIQGDARITAEELLAQLQAHGVKAQGFRTPDIRETLNVRATDIVGSTDAIDPRRMFSALSRSFPHDIRIISGVGHFWNFSTMYLSIPSTVEIDVVLQFGAIGQAFAQGIGAAAAHTGRKHVVLDGDGSFLMQMAELETAVRLNIPLLLIIVNDGGYGAEIHKLKANGFGQKVCDLASWTSPDFVEVTKAFGGKGLKVESESTLDAALAQGLNSSGFFVLDVRVSSSVLSDSYQKLYFGQPNRAPLLRHDISE